MLEASLGKSLAELWFRRLLDDMQFYKLELVNREQNYNKAPFMGGTAQVVYPIDSMRLRRGFWRRTDHWYHESHRKETQWAQQRSSTTDASGAAVWARNENLKSWQKKQR